MKTQWFALALLAPACVLAQPNTVQDTMDYARVIGVSVVPGPQVARRVCHPVEAYDRPAEHSAAGAVLGGLTGALIGSRFGGGHGRDAMTVAGAIGGAVAGDRIAAANAAPPPAWDRCETVYAPGRPAGYQVTYEYGGQQSTVFLDHDPGPSVRVRRTVTVD